MKNLIKKTAVLFAASLLLVGCEKDDAFEPSQSNSQTNSKNKSVNNKVDITDVDTVLSQFLEDMYYENTPAVAIEAENALLYSEAFLNWKYSHDLPISIAKTFEMTFDLNLTNVGGQWIASGSDLLALNQEIEDSLIAVATDSSLDGISSGNKFWSNVLMEIPVSYSSTVSLKIKATLGGQKSFVACTFIDSWRGFHRGKCSITNNSYVVNKMTKRINDDNCLVNHISTCPPPYYPPHANKVEYYVKFKSKYLEEDGVTVNWL